MMSVQGSAKEWSLGCVIPASWSPLAAEAHFTQPRDNFLPDPCTSLSAKSQSLNYREGKEEGIIS